MKNKALKRLIYGLLAFLISLPLLSFGSATPIKNITTDSTFKLKTIIVDAGHGVRPSGGSGHFSPGASGSYSYERDVTLAIAKKLQIAIEKELTGVKVVMTRNTEEDVSWQHRADIANGNKGDLFISLHCNSLAPRRIREVVGHKHRKPVYRTVEVPDRSGKGVLLLVYGFHRSKEEENAIKNTQIEDDPEMNQTSADINDPLTMILINDYKTKFRKSSIHLANLLNSEFIEDGRRSEGIREQGLLVLCHSAMPAVMIETGYINNPDDEAFLNSENGQNEVVDAIVRALKNYKDEVEQVSK
jgi:N-acetylmuramoyl-L-alanine amidase